MKKVKDVKEQKKQDKSSEKKFIEKKPKKEKDQQYVMKKNAGMKILRVFLWVVLIFIFVRGITSIFQQSKEDVVTQMINDFYTNYSDFTNHNEEVISFTENFVREYLTYVVKGEEDYKERLENYVADDFFSNSVNDFRTASSVVYVNAYRVEEYSQSQRDVYVLAEVEYDGSYTKTVLKQITLKVPIYCSGKSFVVESVPQIVSDSVCVDKYMPITYYGTSISDEESSKIKTSIENFLQAYLEADASVIDYYLDDSANKNAFLGLRGSYTLDSISSIQCFSGEDVGIICLVEYKVKDSANGAVLLQKINITLKESGDKYYIMSMDARTGNLNIK